MNETVKLGTMLANAIKNAQNENTAAVRGTIKGSYVNIDGTLYSYSPAVDVQTNEGSIVWCIFNDSKTAVVVVGA